MKGEFLMKKLLVLLLISALAVFVFAGCDLFPSEGEGEGEGEGEVEICPTVSVTSQVTVGDKTFIKGGKQTITVTFAVPTEPVSVYIGSAIKAIPTDAVEVVMHANADKTVYTGTYEFGSLSKAECDEAYIYVETCETCNPCKYPYTVDTVKPSIGQVEVCLEDCTCEGCYLTFKGKKMTDPCGGCGDPSVYCADCCSGFASWSVAIYNKNPFDKCCDTPCYEPIDSGDGDCQVDFTTSICLTPVSGSTRTVFALITALDNVGNKTKWLARITITYNPEGECVDLAVEGIVPGGIAYNCVDTPDFVQCEP